jgi:putative nucleotidyltransferase-like protein
MTSVSSQLAAVVAAHGLPGARPEPLPPFAAAAWDAFRDDVVDQRLAGLALECAADGVLTLDDAQRDELLSLHEQQLAVDLRLERFLRTAARFLEAHGVAYRALKGPVVSRVAYARPELRSFADVDILLPGKQFDDAVELLCRELDLARRFEQPRSGFDRRFGKGVCLTAADGLELDVHRTLAAGPYGATLAVDELFAAEPTRVRIGGHAVYGLPTGLAFVHACLHAVLGGGAPRLVPLRDAAALGSVGFDIDEVRSFCARSRVLAVVGLALERTSAVLAVDLPPALLAGFMGERPTRFDRWALSTYRAVGPSYAAQAAATFWVLPSMRDRLAYARALVWPDDQYLRARDRGHLRRLTRSASLGLRWRPR